MFTYIINYFNIELYNDLKIININENATQEIFNCSHITTE